MKGHCLGVAIIGCVALVPLRAGAADGDLDPAFGDSGVAWLGGADSYGRPAIAVQADGHIVVCDAVSGGATAEDIIIGRFNADGTPDQAFGSRGSVTLPLDSSGDNDLCAAVAVQPDGKIVLAGTRYLPSFPGSIPEFFVARIDDAGAVDPTFGGGTGFSQFPFDGFDAAIANALALDHDGRIIVAGFAGAANLSDPELVVARLLPDGSFDATFNGTGRMSIPGLAQASQIAIDAADRIVMSDGAAACWLVRVLTDGSLDDAFGDGGIVRCGAPVGTNDFFVDDQGRFVLAGAFGTGVSDDDLGIVRVLPNGLPDPSFGNGGIAVVAFDFPSPGQGNDLALKVVGTPDGKIVALGYAEYQSPGIGYQYAVAVRVDAAGVLDPSFGAGGKEVFAFEPSPPSQQRFVSAAVVGGRVIAASPVMDEDSHYFWGDAIVRLQNDAIFVAPFE
jgi:uncharacterized delta-60 repeat protein